MSVAPYWPQRLPALALPGQLELKLQKQERQEPPLLEQKLEKQELQEPPRLKVVLLLKVVPL